MGLQGFGIGTAAPPQPEAPYDASRGIKRLADRLTPPGRLLMKRSSSAPQPGTTAGSQKTGTVWTIDTGEDSVNCLSVTVISGTLWVFDGERESPGSVPDWAFGAMTPVNPVDVSLPLGKYVFTLYASGGDAVYSFQMKAVP